MFLFELPNHAYALRLSMVDTGGFRTHDLLTASQAFYLLNYWPITFHRRFLPYLITRPISGQLPLANLTLCLRVGRLSILRLL